VKTRARGLGRLAYEALIRALVERRKALGLTQQALDDKIGCAGGLVGKWECLNRTASLVSLVMWAEALGAEIAFATVAVPLPLNSTKALLDAIAWQRCSLRLAGGGEAVKQPKEV
jgi:transcriptional regulator with XRE-family HTH domain